MDASYLHAQSLAEFTHTVEVLGRTHFILGLGGMGSGKTASMEGLAKKMGLELLRLDCALLTVQDLFVPWPDKSRDCVDMLPNAQFGLHENKPQFIYFDELCKASTEVLNALNGIINEGVMWGRPFHPKTVMCGTSNLVTEGLGDFMQAHTQNRLIDVRIKPTTVDSVLEFGINNGWHHTMLGAIREFGSQWFQPTEEVKDPNDNPYIPHPLAPERGNVVTMRSVHAASDIFHVQDQLNETQVTSCLIGAIGAPAAMDAMTYAKMANQLTPSADIKTNPDTALVPTSPACQVMVVMREVTNMTNDMVTPFMTYLQRLPAEMQGMFANTVNAEKYTHRKIVTTNKAYSQWCLNNNHLFAADKA